MWLFNLLFSSLSQLWYMYVEVRISRSVSVSPLEFEITGVDCKFHIYALNIDCGVSLEPPRRGGSNEYPQSMFLSRNKKNNVYPCKPQFYYIKSGV